MLMVVAEDLNECVLSWMNLKLLLGEMFWCNELAKLVKKNVSARSFIFLLFWTFKIIKNKLLINIISLDSIQPVEFRPSCFLYTDSWSMRNEFLYHFRFEILFEFFTMLHIFSATVVRTRMLFSLYIAYFYDLRKSWVFTV